jgi:hypothetical protein
MRKLVILQDSNRRCIKQEKAGRKGIKVAYRYTGHTQKNGAVLIVNTNKTTPFFSVCPVYESDDIVSENKKLNDFQVAIFSK